MQEPLSAMRAMMDLPDKAWEFIHKQTPVVPKTGDIVTRALYHWVTWNQHLDSITDWTFRVKNQNNPQL